MSYKQTTATTPITCAFCGSRVHVSAKCPKLPKQGKP